MKRIVVIEEVVSTYLVSEEWLVQDPHLDELFETDGSEKLFTRLIDAVPSPLVQIDVTKRSVLVCED